MKTAENVMHDAYNEKKNLQSSRFALIVASFALACELAACAQSVVWAFEL
jgi:hypothetical protein